MADPFTQPEFLTFRRNLARLEAVAQRAGQADPLLAPDLRTVEALADCLRRFLVDGPMILALTAPAASSEQRAASSEPGPAEPPYTDADVPEWASDIPHSALRTPQLEDPDWDSWDPRVTASPPPAASVDTKQTDAQRSLIFGLLLACNMNDHHIRAWLHSRFDRGVDLVEQLTYEQSVTAIADRQAKLARMAPAAEEI